MLINLESPCSAPFNYSVLLYRRFSDYDKPTFENVVNNGNESWGFKSHDSTYTIVLNSVYLEFDYGSSEHLVIRMAISWLDRGLHLPWPLRLLQKPDKQKHRKFGPTCSFFVTIGTYLLN